MRKYSPALLLLTAAIQCGSPAREAQQAAEAVDARQLSRLDQVIERSIADQEIVGAVLLAEHRGRTVYRKAYGHRALKPQPEPMTEDTIFDMASLTKVMATATSVMILVEEGLLSLSDRVIGYLPEFADPQESCREGIEKSCVTLLHLLTHYSGLRPDIDWEEYWAGYETAIQMGLEEELESAPGEEFVYSDIGYFLLGEIVRRVSGQALEDFSQQRIFTPLGMKDTRYRPPSEWRPRIAPSEARFHHDPAAPQSEDSEMLRGRVHDPTTDRMGGASGHAGLFSCADDVARYARMILNGGELDGVRILSPLSVRAMTTPQSPAGKAARRGLGFDITSPFSSVRGDLFPVGSFGHTGFTGTSLWIDPETQTFVILLTSRLHPDGEGNVVSLRKKVASVVAASLRDVSPWTPPKG